MNLGNIKINKKLSKGGRNIFAKAKYFFLEMF